MLMNINTIDFNSFLITVPKLDKEQYMLLRHLLSSIKDNHSDSGGYFMSINLFPRKNQEDLQALLKRNIEITVVNKVSNTWANFFVLNDLEIKDGKIYFTPAKIIKEIIEESATSQKKSFLKYILFNGIRRKQTLLFIDYLLKLDKDFFEISVVDLKKIFEFTEDQYKNWHTFKKKVVDRVVNEINERTSLRVEYQTSKKEGKKVVAVTFNYYTKESV